MDHLVVEFGDRGRRAVEFLRTAASLLSSPADPLPPRHAECVAYCLREALKTIPASYGGLGGGEWRARSRKVSEAKQRFEQIRGLPGADTDGALRDLLGSIDDLALTLYYADTGFGLTGRDRIAAQRPLVRGYTVGLGSPLRLPGIRRCLGYRPAAAVGHRRLGGRAR